MESLQPQTPNTEVEEQVEAKGDPRIQAVRRWMENRTYTEKLTAVLMSQLFAKELCFDGSDRSIGNDFCHRWEKEVMAHSADSQYLESAPANEAAATTAASLMLAWTV